MSSEASEVKDPVNVDCEKTDVEKLIDVYGEIYKIKVPVKVGNNDEMKDMDFPMKFVKSFSTIYNMLIDTLKDGVENAKKFKTIKTKKSDESIPLFTRVSYYCMNKMIDYLEKNNPNVEDAVKRMGDEKYFTNVENEFLNGTSIDDACEYATAADFLGSTLFLHLYTKYVGEAIKKMTPAQLAEFEANYGSDITKRTYEDEIDPDVSNANVSDTSVTNTNIQIDASNANISDTNPTNADADE
jgi:hypothetical protein